MSRLSIERVNVTFMGDDGIRLFGDGGDLNLLELVSLRDIQCNDNRGCGLSTSFGAQLNVYGSNFLRNDLDGVRADNSEVAFYACVFEKNRSSDDTDRIDAITDGQVYLLTCSISRFDGCHFEEFSGDARPVNKRALMIENSPCCIVSGCRFVNASEDTSSDERGIVCTYASGVGVMACAILPNWFVKVHTAIEIDASTGAAQDCVIFPQRIQPGTTGAMMLPIGLSDSGIVMLGNRRPTTGTGLDVRGPTRGIFVPPYENSDENPLPTLTSSEAGYVLFDTTNAALRLWDGGLWRRIQVA